MTRTQCGFNNDDDGYGNYDDDAIFGLWELLRIFMFIKIIKRNKIILLT